MVIPSPLTVITHYYLMDLQRLNEEGKINAHVFGMMPITANYEIVLNAEGKSIFVREEEKKHRTHNLLQTHLDLATTEKDRWMLLGFTAKQEKNLFSIRGKPASSRFASCVIS